MEYNDEYIAINGVSKSEIYIKKSRFIGLSTSADTEQDAYKFIESIKREYSDATHVCYAFSVGFGSRQILRSSDSGEPANSAGKPILSVIESSNINNIVCVVIRYFGGIKLGIGGLIRAYSQAAKESIRNASTTVCVSLTNLRIEIPYDHIGTIINLVNRFRGKILSMEHGDNIQAMISIRSSLAQEFCNQVKIVNNK